MSDDMIRAIALLWLLMVSSPPVAESLNRSDTLILAAPGDPYYPLAEEMARHEAVPVTHSLEEALARDPAFIIWVVSPASLSDQVMVEVGQVLRDRPTAISVGIISGHTLENARALWLRAPDVEGDRIFAANALNPAGNIDAELIEFGENGATVQPLSQANLLHSLEVADYWTFSGHGASSYLRFGENTRLKAGQIPSLPPSVIATSSCNTFRLWEDNSLPLDMVRQGAAAYAGFVFSPNSGYLIGAYGEVPFRYTWPDFPIGHAIQVQNRGTLQGFAQLPYYWLLGDPRIALRAEAPYQLVKTESSNGTLTLSYAGAPAGIVPVHIPGGARYRFVELPGISAAWDHDPFYNARLQTVNIGEDKFILFRHDGGEFTVQLHTHPSWLWVVGDLMADSLDTTYLFFPEHGMDIILLGVGILMWPIAWLASRRNSASHTVLPALLTGLGVTVLQGLYALARLERLTITSKIVGFRPLSLAGTFLLVSCAAFLLLNARSWRGRIVALLVATSSALLPAVAHLGLFLVANTLASTSGLGTGLWNASLATQPLLVLAFECVLFSLVFWALSRRTQSATKEIDTP